MKKKFILTLIIVSIVLIIMAIVLLLKKDLLKEQKIDILDATYSCENIPEKFYEDDKYIYSFPCTKSTSVFVKLEDGSKMLVTKALEEEKVTIDELLKAGLEVIKNEK